MTNSGNPAAENGTAQQELLRALDAERAAREAAERTEARFRALIERSSEGISLITAEGAVIYRSPAAVRIRGGVPGEEEAVGDLDSIHPDDRARFDAEFAALLADPATPRPVELRVRHRDGSWRWLDAVFTNLIDDPAVGAVVSNFRDVTERHQMMDLLRASEAQHRRITEELRLELTERRLDEEGSTRARSSYGTRRRWRPWVASRAAWRTTSTTSCRSS